MTNTFH